MDEKPENTSVGQIISDLNKTAEKKAQRKENTLLSFVMKAIARDQEKNILISNFQREIKKNLQIIRELQIENEVKEDLLTEKIKEVETLKHEIEKLETLLQQEKQDQSAKIKEKKIKRRKTSTKIKNEIISTFRNIIPSPPEVTSSNSVASTSTNEVDNPENLTSTKSTRAFKRSDSNVANIIYNLRKRSKQK